jgi:hypothetical protein
MKLVEESEGQGRLTVAGEPVGAVPYAIRRYQAMTTGGMPVPGLHRIEGRVGLGALSAAIALEADTPVHLELEDGRTLALTLVDADGQVLAEGHGPGRCGCC